MTIDFVLIEGDDINGLKETILKLLASSLMMLAFPNMTKYEGTITIINAHQVNCESRSAAIRHKAAIRNITSSIIGKK